MSTAFNWEISQLDRQTADGFVTTVHYRVNAEDTGTYASTYGTLGYAQTEGESYTPYDQLTQEQVVGWVQASLNKEAVEASLQDQIAALKNPVHTTGVPWATTP